MGAFGADPGPLPFADRQQVLADIAAEHGLTLARARTIARTEIGSAQSAATLALGEARAERGEAIDKIWITTEDDRRRPSH
ncbi:MAG TPA: hypothetical protein PKY87_15445, partial [Terricaulis sp.]|nr:hypothetical protein [Terricaulis sp.]